jgi:hypothetical protein
MAADLRAARPDEIARKLVMAVTPHCCDFATLSLYT